MEQIIEFFQRLTDTSDWPPRWFCGRWTDFHGWLYIFSDLMIWLAYMTIPLVLIRFVIIRTGIPFKRVFLLFGAFILLCGLTHLMDAVMFWWPAYRLNALIRFLTGLVSIGTVVALIRYFNEAIRLRTIAEVERELSSRQQAVQELTRSNEELQQFAYVASHDLQAPLKTISNYMTLLESKYGTQLDTNALQLIHSSTAAAGRMRMLINDLLNFSRVGTHTELKPIDLNELVADVLTELQDDIRTAGADVQVEPLPTVTGHRTDLSQLFSNLINNGIKYRRPDVAPRITIRAENRGDAYQFAVSDNGIGIDAVHFDRIFQIFHRLHTRSEYPGTGIGLATCKKVVDLYGGSIWLDSTVGQGTTFYFSIPKQVKLVQQDVQTNSLYSVS